MEFQTAAAWPVAGQALPLPMARQQTAMGDLSVDLALFLVEPSVILMYAYSLSPDIQIGCVVFLWLKSGACRQNEMLNLRRTGEMKTLTESISGFLSVLPQTSFSTDSMSLGFGGGSFVFSAARAGIARKMLKNKAMSNVNGFKIRPLYQLSAEIDESCGFLYLGSKWVCGLALLDEAASPALAERVASHLREAGADIIWSLRTRIDPAFDNQLLERLRDAGCRELWIGLEGISPDVLKRMNKTDRPEEYGEIAARMMRSCSDVGIGLHFCLMLGFPGERGEDLKRLVEFFKAHAETLDRIPFFATFNRFSVTPGS